MGGVCSHRHGHHPGEDPRQGQALVEQPAIGWHNLLTLACWHLRSQKGQDDSQRADRRPELQPPDAVHTDKCGQPGTRTEHVSRLAQLRCSCSCMVRCKHATHTLSPAHHLRAIRDGFCGRYCTLNRPSLAPCHVLHVRHSRCPAAACVCARAGEDQEDGSRYQRVTHEKTVDWPRVCACCPHRDLKCSSYYYHYVA